MFNRPYIVLTLACPFGPSGPNWSKFVDSSFQVYGRTPTAPQNPLKIQLRIFKKKFVELRCQEVVEKSTYTLIIRPKNDQKTQIFSSNHQMTGDWGETAYQTPLGLCPVFNSASFGAKTRAIKSAYALP